MQANKEEIQLFRAVRNAKDRYEAAVILDHAGLRDETGFLLSLSPASVANMLADQVSGGRRLIEDVQETQDDTALLPSSSLESGQASSETDEKPMIVQVVTVPESAQEAEETAREVDVPEKATKKPSKPRVRKSKTPKNVL